MIFRKHALKLAIVSYLGLTSLSAIAVTDTYITPTIDGSPPNGVSTFNGTSKDGRYSVFTSKASNLVLGDTNGVSDVFLYDHETEKVERLALSVDGEQFTTPHNDDTLPSLGTPYISADSQSLIFLIDNYRLSTNPLNHSPIVIDLPSRELNDYLPDLQFDGDYGVQGVKHEKETTIEAVASDLNSALIRHRIEDSEYRGIRKSHSEVYSLVTNSTPKETREIASNTEESQIEIDESDFYLRPPQSAYHRLNSRSVFHESDTALIGPPALSDDGKYLALLIEGKLHFQHVAADNRFEFSIDTAPIPSITEYSNLKVFGESQTALLSYPTGIQEQQAILQVDMRTGETSTYTLPKHFGSAISQFTLSSPYDESHRYLLLSSVEAVTYGEKEALNYNLLYNTQRNTLTNINSIETMPTDEREEKDLPVAPPRPRYDWGKIYIRSFEPTSTPTPAGITGLEGTYRIGTGISFPESLYLAPFATDTNGLKAWQRIRPADSTNPVNWALSAVNDEGDYKIVNTASVANSLCMTALTSYLYEPVLFECTAGDAQQIWRVSAMGDQFRLQGQESGKCLFKTTTYYNAIPRVRFATCSADETQAFTLEELDTPPDAEVDPLEGIRTLTPANSTSKQIGWTETRAGAAAKLIANSSDLDWTVTHYGETGYSIHTNGTSQARCLALPSWSNDLPILNRCDNGSRQYWEFDGSAATGYSLINKETGRCLSRVAGSDDLLRLRDCDDSVLQKFNVQ